MAINSGSRYESSVVDYFRKEEDGTTYPVVRYEFDDLSEASFFYHTYQTGETLHALSQRYFHTPSLWWTIAEYNPEVIDITRIPNNTSLRIPSA
jgi:hypothetical protein